MILNFGDPGDGALRDRRAAPAPIWRPPVSAPAPVRPSPVVIPAPIVAAPVTYPSDGSYVGGRAGLNTSLPALLDAAPGGGIMPPKIDASIWGAPSASPPATPTPAAVVQASFPDTVDLPQPETAPAVPESLPATPVVTSLPPSPAGGSFSVGGALGAGAAGFFVAGPVGALIGAVVGSRFGKKAP